MAHSKTHFAWRQDDHPCPACIWRTWRVLSTKCVSHITWSVWLWACHPPFLHLCRMDLDFKSLARHASRGRKWAPRKLLAQSGVVLRPMSDEGQRTTRSVAVEMEPTSTSIVLAGCALHCNATVTFLAMLVKTPPRRVKWSVSWVRSVLPTLGPWGESIAGATTCLLIFESVVAS